MAKKLKTVPVKTKTSGKPRCPMHKEPMAFNATRARWDCPMENCKMVAWPKKDADTHGAVHVLSGKVEFHVVQVSEKTNGQYEAQMLLVCDGYAINITPHLDKSKADNNVVSETVHEGVTARVSLRFDNVVELGPGGRT